MLDSEIITATFFGDPDPVHRRAMCGRSAVEFDHIYSVLVAGCAAAEVATWIAWEQRTADEALQRFREFH